MGLGGARSVLLGALLMLGSLIPAPAQIPDAKASAREILSQARAALGGDDALDALRSLSAQGDFRSGAGQTEASGDVAIDLLFPDKLMRTMKWSPMQGMKVTTVEVMNGAEVWTDSQVKGPNLDSGGGSGMGRSGRGGGMGRGGNRGSTGSGSSAGGGKSIGGAAPDLVDEKDRQQLASDFFCLMTVLWLHSPDSSAIETGKESEIDLNGASADFLRIIAGDGSVIRLAIDRETHRPILAAYGGRKEDESGAEGSPGTQIQIYFSEYSPIAGKRLHAVWLPHEISKTRDGVTVEDMHIKAFQLNPHLKAQQFEKKKQ